MIPELIGTVVGGDRITAKFGEGGMGVVYGVQHERRGGRTASELLHAERSTLSENDRQR